MRKKLYSFSQRKTIIYKFKKKNNQINYCYLEENHHSFRKSLSIRIKTLHIYYTFPLSTFKEQLILRSCYLNLLIYNHKTIILCIFRFKLRQEE